MAHLVLDDYFARVNTRVTRTAFLRLKEECERREKLEAARVPFGKIILELVMAHLPPYEGEEVFNTSNSRKAPKGGSKKPES